MRLGFLLLVFGVAVFGGTVANDSRGYMLESTSFDASPGVQWFRTFFPVKRTWRVTVESSPDFRGKLYILSESGFGLWRNEDVFDPLVTIDIHGGMSTVFDPPVRGFYGFVIVNELNETRGVAFRLSEYGWEYDLLAASGVVACVGGVLIVIGVVIKTVTVSKRAEADRKSVV